MSDLRITYEEEMVGANHPTKPDTLNRLFLGGPSPTLRDIDGKVLTAKFKKQATDPGTGAGEIAVFCKDDGDKGLKLFWRDESNGSVQELAGAPKIAYFSGSQLMKTQGWQTIDVDISSMNLPDYNKAFLLMEGGSHQHSWADRVIGYDVNVLLTSNNNARIYCDVTWKNGTLHWAFSVIYHPSLTVYSSRLTFSCNATYGNFTMIPINHGQSVSIPDTAIVIPRIGSYYLSTGRRGWGFDAQPAQHKDADNIELRFANKKKGTFTYYCPLQLVQVLS